MCEAGDEEHGVHCGKGVKLGLCIQVGCFSGIVIRSNLNEYIGWCGVFGLVRSVWVGVGSRAREG